MLISSMILISLGVYYYTEKNKFLDKCRLIKCKIIKIDEMTLGEPVLTFREVNGSYPPFNYNVSYDPSEEELDYKLNEVYEVYYYNKDVNKSEIKSFMVNYETSFILFMIGIAFFIDFPIMLFVSRLQAKRVSQSAESTYGIKDNVMSE